MKAASIRFLLAVFFVMEFGTLPLWAQKSPKERTQLAVTLDVREGVDDNAEGRGVISGLTEVSPEFRLTQELARGYWHLEYRPTLRYFSAFETEDRLDHSLRFRLDHALSKRWRVDFNQSFLRSTNPFLRVESDGSVDPAASSVVFGPNRGFVGPERRFTQWSSQLSFRYRTGAHSNVSFGARYFREDQSGEFLFDQETQDYFASYERQYARNKSLSASYSFQRFRTTIDDERVDTNSLLFFHSYEFRPRSNLVVFGGLQFSRVKAEPVVLVPFLFTFVPLAVPTDERVTNLALGAVFMQRLGDRTALQVSVSRRVSDGGGFIGTVVQNAARVSLRRRWTRRFTVSTGAYVTDNNALVDPLSRVEARTLGLSAEVDYALGRRISLLARYDFSRFASGPGELRSLLGRNRFAVGLRYHLGTFSLER